MKARTIIAIMMINIIIASCSTQKNVSTSQTSRTDTHFTHLDSLVSRIVATSSTDILIKLWPNTQEMPVFAQKCPYNPLLLKGGTIPHREEESPTGAKFEGKGQKEKLNNQFSGLNPDDPNIWTNPYIEIEIHHRDTTITEQTHISKGDTITSHEEQQAKKVKSKIKLLAPSHIFALILAIALCVCAYVWASKRMR